MDTRARLTIPDLVYALMSIAFLGALSPVFYDGFRSNLGELSTGEEYLFQMMTPMLILILLTVVWVKTIGGRP